MAILASREEDAVMIGYDQLQRGLFGMANASRAGTMAGHLGAAVVAGYFFGENHPDLDEGVLAAVRRDQDRIAGGEESIWFNPKKVGLTAAQLFSPLPEGKPVPNATATIAAALARNIDRTRQSGHNVIFGSIAIRALADHPDLATAKVTAGITRLIAGFDGAHAGRGYYGKAKGWKVGNAAPVAAGNDLPEYQSTEQMARVMIDELTATAQQHRQGFGGLFHLVNHAAALAELEQHGFAQLARDGWSAHRHHLLLYRALPDLTEELGPLEAAGEDPLTPAYWKRTRSRQWSAWLTHRIKTLYGFYTLLGYVEDETRKAAARQAFRYLMA